MLIHFLVKQQKGGIITQENSFMNLPFIGFEDLQEFEVQFLNSKTTRKTTLVFYIFFSFQVDELYRTLGENGIKMTKGIMKPFTRPRVFS